MFNSVFDEPWWLDAVAPGQWDAVTVEKGGAVYARLPYVVRNRFGLRMITMPKLTPALGPWLRYDSPKYVNRVAETLELMDALILKLPRADIFAQAFHYSMTNWLPFCWRGYSQTTLYSYVIDNSQPLEKIWSNMADKTRNGIRTAERKFGLVVETRRDIDALYGLVEATFRRQRKSVPYSRELLARVESAAAERMCGQTFFCFDGQGRHHAAMLIVWSHSSAYCLLTGSDPELRNSGALSLVFWHAIQYMHSRTMQFDFEGSVIPSIEKHFRGFGGTQKPYFYVTHANLFGKLYLNARKVLYR